MKSQPRWIWFTLLAGSALLLVWGTFVLSFTAEPSAVGRTGAAVMLIGGGSVAAGLLGAVAAFGLYRRARWALSLAWVASVLMVLSVVSSWAGIPALIGLAASRSSVRN